jgi:hypothetical protein
MPQFSDQVRDYIVDFFSSKNYDAILRHVTKNIPIKDRTDQEKVNKALLQYAALKAISIALKFGLFIRYAFYEKNVTLDTKVYIDVDEQTTLTNVLQVGYKVGLQHSQMVEDDARFTSKISRGQAQALKYLYKEYGNHGRMYEERYHNFLCDLLHGHESPEDLPKIALKHNIRVNNSLYIIVKAILCHPQE